MLYLIDKSIKMHLANGSLLWLFWQFKSSIYATFPHYLSKFQGFSFQGRIFPCIKYKDLNIPANENKMWISSYNIWKTLDWITQWDIVLYGVPQMPR